jgi:NADH:ubiquinone oxidoreductase subunit 6 (subunit J)
MKHFLLILSYVIAVFVSFTAAKAMVAAVIDHVSNPSTQAVLVVLVGLFCVAFIMLPVARVYERFFNIEDYD